MKFAKLYLYSLLCVLLVSTLEAATPQEVSTTPHLVWRRALGGKINTVAAQGPGGDIYIVADDRALHSLNPLTGEINWIYRPGGRLRPLLMVSPDGTIYVQTDRQELYAVTPGGTGRWKLRMGAEAASLPAAAPDGRIIVTLTGGRIVCVSRHGIILWSVDATAEVSSAPVVSARGLVWVPLADGRIIVLDTFGEELAHATMKSPVSVLAMDPSMRIWAGCSRGQLAVFPEPEDSSPSDLLVPEFETMPASSRVTTILTDDQGNAQVFSAQGDVIYYDRQGNELNRGEILLNGRSPAATASGVLFVPAPNGNIRVLHLDNTTGAPLPFDELKGESVLADPLLSDEGMLIAGGGDWVLYAWKADVPGSGWRQFRGSARRSGSFPVEPVVLDRARARQDPGFFYRETLAVSEDLSERMKLVEELKSYPDSREMHRALPWVDLLLEDLVATGTIRMANQKNLFNLSQPTIRAQGYLLIAREDDFRKRELLLECLRNENDTGALAAGFRALGLIGSDWDGAAVRMIAQRYRKHQLEDEQLTLDTARALVDLVRYNGKLSNPEGISLMTALLNSHLSSAGHDKIIAIMHNIAGF